MIALATTALEALAPPAAAGTMPDESLTRVERPESCSRFSRARSARMSAADW